MLLAEDGRMEISMLNKKVTKYGILVIICGGLILLTAKMQYNNINERDTTEPKISFEEKTCKAKVSSDSTDLLKGVSAEDETDGNVSKSLMVEKITKKEDSYNKFNITYIAFDNAGNCGRASRTLVYTDYKPPKFIIKKPLRFTVDQDVNLTDYISVEDEIDGDITAFVKVTGLESYLVEKKEGIYECTASVSNSVGDTATIPIKVEFYINSYEDMTTHPQIILKQYVAYLDKGENFYSGDYLDYIVDNENKSIDFGPMVEVGSGDYAELVTQAVADKKPGSWTNVSNITCKTNVDVNVPGTYKAIYTYTSEKTGSVGTAELVLVVQD